MTLVKKLRESARQTGSLICMGIDPVPDKIPLEYDGTERMLTQFYTNIFGAIKETGTIPGLFKPNQGFFIKKDQPLLDIFIGSRALANVIRYLRKNFPNVPRVLDYKRGDIAKSSDNYAMEAVNWAVDAVTVSPYMGTDSVMPFVSRTKGMYVLVRTSNPGAKDFQDLILEDGRPLYMAVAEKTVEWSKKAKGDVGAVVGATSPDELERIAGFYVESGQDIPLLIPGVGAQGGTAQEVMERLRKVGYELPLVRINSSSGINFAWEKEGNREDYAMAAVRAIQKLNDEIAYKP